MSDDEYRYVTWGEFKAWIDTIASDETTIDYIDISFLKIGDIKHDRVTAIVDDKNSLQVC